MHILNSEKRVIFGRFGRKDAIESIFDSGRSFLVISQKRIDRFDFILS